MTQVTYYYNDMPIEIIIEHHTEMNEGTTGEWLSETIIDDYYVYYSYYSDFQCKLLSAILNEVDEDEILELIQ